MGSPPLLRWRLNDDTFLMIYGPTDWFFRLGGRGLSMRDHRVCPPLFSERHSGRHGLRKRRYLHIGPYCLHALAHLAGRKVADA